MLHSTSASSQLAEQVKMPHDIHIITFTEERATAELRA